MHSHKFHISISSNLAGNQLEDLVNLTWIEDVWYSFGMGPEIVSHDQALIEYLDFRLYFNTVAVPSLRSG